MSEKKLLAIWARNEWGGEMRSLAEGNLVGGKGLSDDVSFGSRRQVTIIEEEVWISIMEQLGSDLPGFTRRANLMVRGIQLKETKGRILRIGSCRLEIAGETKPCSSMDEKLQGLKTALKPDWNGGVFGSVLNGGKICVGDNVSCEE